jgi:hypothetical protein
MMNAIVDLNFGTAMSLPADVVKTLSSPVAFPAVPNFLLHLPNATCDSLKEKLGAPQVTEWVDGLGNADIWAFEFECGLQVALECLQSSYVKHGARVVADSPEIEHVHRHLSFLNEESCPISEEGLADELKLLVKCYPNRQQEIANLHAWQVWRIDDNGNVFKVGEPTSERAARCAVKQFEVRPHKQMYWCERI